MNTLKKLLIGLMAIIFTLINISPWLTEEAKAASNPQIEVEDEIIPTTINQSSNEPEELTEVEDPIEEPEETPEPTPTPKPKVEKESKVKEEPEVETPTTQSVVSSDGHEDEIWVLAQAMCGESFENNYEDMLRVGMALYNRVDSPDPYFPDDLISVIRQPSQVHGYHSYNNPSGVFLQASEYVVNTYYSIKAGADLPWEYGILYWSAGTGANYGSNIFRTDY